MRQKKSGAVIVIDFLRVLFALTAASAAAAGGFDAPEDAVELSSRPTFKRMRTVPSR